MRLLSTLLLIIGCFQCLQGQELANVSGRVTDAITEEPIELVTVYIEGTSTATETAENGRYSINIPANETVTLIFTRIGYKPSPVEISPMPVNSGRQVDIALAPQTSDLEVIIKESKLEEGGMIRETVEQLKLLPTTSGNFESILPSIALGTSGGTGGELSSQYNVRGGNYDENLVYVNGFEIYRPQLIRAGQQEGLSFPNIDLIRDLSFSSGGFEARYGDKLSSVLDVNYKRPDSLRGSVELSFLGGSGHVEGSLDVGDDGYRKLRYLVGARYKTTNYLLGTLDVEGEYTPNFTDLQAYLTYDITRDLQLGVIGNYNRSVYEFIPQERNTAFGLINFALQLNSVFEGREVDDFTTGLGGASLTYIPDKRKNPLYLKLLAYNYGSDENERFDITGDYSLRQIESNLGSSEFGEVVAELGVGTQQEFVRNFLDIDVRVLEHKGGIEFQGKHDNNNVSSSNFVQWGIKYKQETIQDRINEWERLDSAGYSLPFSDQQVLLFDVLKTENDLQSNRFSAFLQDTYTFRNNASSEWRVSAGVRASYWDLNEELVISPRAQIQYKPLQGKRDVSYRLAGGIYAQPPFYRELRRPDGSINRNLRAQKSAHIVGGLTYDFYLGSKNPKKFRFITEAYYKSLWDLVSYEIENVRIRYSGENDATGYVAGLDMRMNGEFVPGAESWINLSFLRARESLTGVQHMRQQKDAERVEDSVVEVDDVPRPTDQLMNLSISLHDSLPNVEDFKMQLNMTVGTGLPFGLRGDNEVFRNTYRFNPYHRIDIGFSWQLWDEPRARAKPNHFLSFARSSFVRLEIFNLMQVQNQAGNTWIKTVFDQQYAIPNYLTSRRINLRFRMDF